MAKRLFACAIAVMILFTFVPIHVSAADLLFGNTIASANGAAKGHFGDLADANAYAREAIQAAAECGIVAGKRADLFDPAGEITRGEALTMLENVLRIHPEVKKWLAGLSKK